MLSNNNENEILNGETKWAIYKSTHTHTQLKQFWRQTAKCKQSVE